MSDPDYEDLICEGYIEDDCVLIVTQEHGFSSLDVQLLPGPGGRPRELKYDVLISLLSLCRERLWELRRTEP
jgi:hypothetical protein